MLPVTWLPGVATEIKGHRHFKALITHAHWLKSVEDFRAILLKGWQTCRSAGLRLKTKSRLWVKRCLWITTWLHSGSVYCFDRNAATSLGSSCFLFLLKSAEFSHKVTQNPHACLAWRPSQEISNNQRSLMLFFLAVGLVSKPLWDLSHCASSGFIVVDKKYKSINLYYQAKMWCDLTAMFTFNPKGADVKEGVHLDLSPPPPSKSL